MMGHTPGPWAVYERDPLIVVAADGFSVCDCVPGNPIDVSETDAHANARLIAAAPALLEALEFVQVEFREFLNDDPHSRRVRDKIRAAIALATEGGN